MKTLVKTVVFAALIATAYAVPTAAQCDPDDAKPFYDAFLADRRAGTVDARLKAVDAGKKYVAMCEKNTEEDIKQIVDYIQKDIPRIEKWIGDQTRFAKFNDAGKAKRYEDALTVAKEILALEPANSKLALDLQLYIASAALEVAAKKGGDNPFWSEALNFANEAIASMDGGKTSAEWGVFEMNYKQATDAASKNNASAWMNFTAALASLELKNPKGAADYFYKTSQIQGGTDKIKGDSFREIGVYYFSEVFRLQGEVKKKFESNDDAQIEEGKKQLAMAKGYAERGLDAFGRAREVYVKINRADDAGAALESLKMLYSFRSGGKAEGQDEFVANLLKNPFPNPATEPAPVEEEEPAAEPATTTGN